MEVGEGAPLGGLARSLFSLSTPGFPDQALGIDGFGHGKYESSGVSTA